MSGGFFKLSSCAWSFWTSFSACQLVVAFGDSSIARIVGVVFRCNLCDPHMMLSCAFILVKKKIFWLVFHPCFQGSQGGALHLVLEPMFKHWDLYVYVAHMVGVALAECECLGENS